MKQLSHSLTTPLIALIASTLLATPNLVVSGPSASTQQPAMAVLPPLNKSYREAKVETDGDILTVTTGRMTRQWKWTGRGLVTQSVVNADGHRLASGAGQDADWDLGDLGQGKLLSLLAIEDDDERFTSRHLAVEAEIAYSALHIKYVIWAYPDAPGLRTQLWLKKAGKNNATLAGEVSEQLALENDPKSIITWGYKAGLKADQEPYQILDTEMLGANHEVKHTSGLLVDYDGQGLVLVKESHAHSQLESNGCAVGGFLRKDKLLQVNGLGILPQDIAADFKFCWANWMIVFQGEELDAQLTLKQFDRFRYPIHPKRDVFIMANTWGSEDMQEQCKYKAREENVLREITACAELGVDLLQIDDGWQDKKWAPKPVGKPKGKPILLNGDKVPQEYTVYPDGFGRVREAASAAGITLGLWHAWDAPLNAIKTNMDNGDFKAFKLDFAKLTKKKDLDHLYKKGRELVKHSDYTAVVNWDVTEKMPRMGFYFGRDCGNLYLANRKASTVRERVLYIPWQVLRDGWLLSKYTNLNKIQLTFQNKDQVQPKAKTDADDHPHAYNLAITLMSSPILFLETQLLSQQATDILKPMIAKYKAEREKMYQGYVFPIGSMPDNASWTGFQNHNPETGSGYMTVFRELENAQSKAKLALHFIAPGTKLQLTNVLTGESRNAILNQEAELEFEIPQAPDFAFMKYEPLL
ncbi:MAG: hypothetical protein AAF065_13365 [Verrucomicrobiota bacterium]